MSDNNSVIKNVRRLQAISIQTLNTAIKREKNLVTVSMLRAFQTLLQVDLETFETVEENRRILKDIRVKLNKKSNSE